MDTDVQTNSKNPFLVKASKFFDDNHEKLFIVKLSYLVPWLIPLLSQIVQIQIAIYMGLRSILPRFMNRFEELPGFWIMNQVQSVIKERTQRKERSDRVDLLQLMLDAATLEDIQVNISYLLLMHEIIILG